MNRKEIRKHFGIGGFNNQIQIQNLNLSKIKLHDYGTNSFPARRWNRSSYLKNFKVVLFVLFQVFDSRVDGFNFRVRLLKPII
jgi:hypothetical protein